jgi:hypothetical protein
MLTIRIAVRAGVVLLRTGVRRLSGLVVLGHTLRPGQMLRNDIRPTQNDS